MSDTEFILSNLHQMFEQFLESQARKNTYFPNPITLKYDPKNHQVSDITKTFFQIDIKNSEDVNEHLEDKSFKYMRLNNWDFQFIFQGKECTSVILLGNMISLIVSKNQKKDIKECQLKIPFLKQQDMDSFQFPIKGYLNRIGKRNLVKKSDNVAIEAKSLVSYVKRGTVISLVEKIILNPEQFEENQIDPLTMVNKEGIKVLEKLRNFITKQGLMNFMRDQELSQEGSRKVRRLIFSQPYKEGRKIYGKNTIEHLQKALDE